MDDVRKDIISCRSKSASALIVKLADVMYNNMTVAEALEYCLELIESGCKAEIFFLNADCLRIAQKDLVYRSILNSASLVLPDGIGLRIATRVYGDSMRENCNGTDFSPRLMKELATRGKTCFFLGSKEGVAAKAAKNAEAKIPGLRIVGTHNGYFQDDDAVVDLINRSGADVLFVAMGAPLQEKWISRNRDKIKAGLILGVGALFDYLSGNVRRAPIALQRAGMEWAWRILWEPKRLFRRYVLHGIPFMIRLVCGRLCVVLGGRYFI